MKSGKVKGRNRTEEIEKNYNKLLGITNENIDDDDYENTINNALKLCLQIG